ncbi:class F sortase [Dactylosporangium vinaceum]|uniref:Class F sortase n=1 Tax=Dactylosporangium vinaceum TaxID=53362 RepID=A0ABV5MAJ9_9ACTN|nr:class F sortase [Dactylosporangium vinaceum]UAB92952.1 class F sortase [Dactylosporangium vinaceum]
MNIRDTAGSRRALGWAALGAGLAAVVVAIALALTARPGPVDAGVLPPPPADSGAATGGSAPPSSPAPTRELATPTRLHISALGVDAPVDPAGVTSAGAFGVPDDPGRVGWWIGSALPGAPAGTVLIAGHVDTAKAGRGALYDLEHLPVGAEVGVASGDLSVTYRVAARRSYGKQRLPRDLFTTAGPARLVLITCGGTFRNGSYASNVVVYAEPVAD